MSRVVSFLVAAIGFVKSATVQVYLRVSVTGPISAPDKPKPRLKARVVAAARFGLLKALDLARLSLAILLSILVASLPGTLVVITVIEHDGAYVLVCITVILGLVIFGIMAVRCGIRARIATNFAEMLGELSSSQKAAVAARCQRDLGFLVPSVEEALSGDPKAVSKFNSYALDEVASGAERISLMRAKEIMEPKIFGSHD